MENKEDQEILDDEFFAYEDSSSENEEAPSQNEKDSPTVGEVYRRVLARFTCKEIRRALLKYRELMPKQSDWNRKLTQATLNPEIGFRYLYRCGQIDDNNHRTIQKMLRYVERQDIIPFFENIIYNHTLQNASLDDLKFALCDPVDEYFIDEFLRLDDEMSVHPEPEYTIYRCRSATDHRVTRSKAAKRRQNDYEPYFQTHVKRARRSNANASLNDSDIASPCKASTPSESKPKKARTSEGSSQCTTTECVSSAPPTMSAKYRMCEVRMQVRAEHGNYENLLRDRLASNRENVFDRQLDLFNQASTILRLQDLGEISCDMRFADLLHLDCFWREFLNGGLSREIKAEFSRENISGGEEVDLRNVNFHVGLNYREYEKGRQILLSNYKPQPVEPQRGNDETEGSQATTDAANGSNSRNSPPQNQQPQ